MFRCVHRRFLRPRTRKKLGAWKSEFHPPTVESRRFPMKVSVVIPVYNEQATLRQVIERVFSVGLEIELLCVDDGS